MSENISELTIENYTCPNCNNQTDWHKVYYEDLAKIVRVGNAYIAWCDPCKDYILLTAEKLLTNC